MITDQQDTPPLLPTTPPPQAMRRTVIPGPDDSSYPLPPSDNNLIVPTASVPRPPQVIASGPPTYPAPPIPKATAPLGSLPAQTSLLPTPHPTPQMSPAPMPREVTLDRGDDGLGFSIVGGFGSSLGDLPIYVKSVFDKGSAAREGTLRRGDQILEVNGVSLKGLTHAHAVSVLKEAKGTVTLLILPAK